MLSLIYVLDIYAAIIQETYTKKFSVELSRSWRYARKINDGSRYSNTNMIKRFAFIYFRDINSGEKQFCCSTL